MVFNRQCYLPRKTVCFLFFLWSAATTPQATQRWGSLHLQSGLVEVGAITMREEKEEKTQKRVQDKHRQSETKKKEVLQS